MAVKKKTRKQGSVIVRGNVIVLLPCMEIPRSDQNNLKGASLDDNSRYNNACQYRL